jgi:hypothetical protein
MLLSGLYYDACQNSTPPWRGKLEDKEAVISPNGAACLFSASSFFL